MRVDYTSRAKLISAVLSLKANEAYAETRLPGPNDDAQAELDDERLLIAAREFVAAHEGQEVVGG